MLLFDFFVLCFVFECFFLLKGYFICFTYLGDCGIEVHFFLRTELKFWCIGKGEGLENFGERKNMIQIYLTSELFK